MRDKGFPLQLPVLLLLDPLRLRRTVFQQELGRSFEVLCCRSTREAREMLDQHHPAAVVASMHQVKRHGLALCTRLRSVPGGDCVMIVHGSPQESDIATLRAGLGSEWKVDNWLPSDVPPALVRLTVEEAVKAATSSSGRPEHVSSGRMEVRSANNLEPEIDDEQSWGKLLMSEVSMKTLKSLATKQIGPGSDR